MNMKYNYLTTIWESIVFQMYKFLVEKYVSSFSYNLFMVEIKKMYIVPEIHYMCVKVLSHIVVNAISTKFPLC